MFLNTLVTPLLVCTERSCNSNNSQNFVSALMNINVCPPPSFGKMFTKSTDENRVGPPPPINPMFYVLAVSIVSESFLSESVLLDVDVLSESAF